MNIILPQIHPQQKFFTSFSRRREPTMRWFSTANCTRAWRRRKYERVNRARRRDVTASLVFRTPKCRPVRIGLSLLSAQNGAS